MRIGQPEMERDDAGLEAEREERQREHRGAVARQGRSGGRERVEGQVARFPAPEGEQGEQRERGGVGDDQVQQSPARLTSGFSLSNTRRR